MSVPNSNTDIVNLALDVIKTENINDVEVPGDDKQAVIAKRWYDAVRTDILEGFPWNFATKRGPIALSATAPDFGFDDAYLLPNDYLSLNFIKYWDFPLSRWNYVIENGFIYIDNSGEESLQVGYTYSADIVGKFSPSFKMYFAYALAERIVFKLTGNVALHARVVKGRQHAELNAKAKNGKANPPIAYRESRMLGARRLYGGSRTSGLYTGQNGRT